MKRPQQIDVFRHYHTEEMRLQIIYHDGTIFDEVGPELKALFIASGMPAKRAAIEASRYV